MTKPERLSYSPWRFCVAPMMQYTDRHFRYLTRILSRRARVYTEMVVADAIIHGDRERFLRHEMETTPGALQLGGCDPSTLAKAARIGAQYGYEEINLNVGCPSPRVKSGCFGAALFAQPDLVANCVASMRDAIDVPVTVKTRIGLDREESEEPLFAFVEKIRDAGCEVVIVHARNAWLDGLSPRENREIPPLRYDVVTRLKQEFPLLTVVINGGIASLEAAHQHLAGTDGVMLGRAVIDSPYLLNHVDEIFFDEHVTGAKRDVIVDRYLDYVIQEFARGTRMRHLVKPIQHLYQGQRGAKQWRRHLGEQCSRASADPDDLREAIRFVRAEYDGIPA